jgi:hypothetical protein
MNGNFFFELLNNQHEFRDSMYELILVHELVDSFTTMV